MTHQHIPPVFDNSPIPAIAGIGLKPDHYDDILNTRPAPLWFEIHAENYMSDGGPHHKYLETIRADYPLSVHGVSLSIGSAQPLNRRLLERTRTLMDRYQPALVSEHLSWSVAGETYFNDLLPLPYTEETLRLAIAHIDETQDVLGHQILIENPSTYLQFVDSPIPEHELLSEIVARTGCGLLVDVNNLYVNARNHGVDTAAWLAGIPAAAVGEIHLAGHNVNTYGDQEILIDDHGSEVCDPVWELYQRALDLFGPKPSLIEWDTRIPTFDVLMTEAGRANQYLQALAEPEALHA